MNECVSLAYDVGLCLFLQCDVGRCLFIDADTNGVPDGAAILTTTTDVTGSYIFTNVAPGQYLVVETDPIGLNSTGDVDGGDPNSIAVTLISGSGSTVGLTGVGMMIVWTPLSSISATNCSRAWHGPTAFRRWSAQESRGL